MGRVPRPDAVPGPGHPARLQPLRFLHPRGGRPAQRADPLGVARAEPPARAGCHPGVDRRGSARARAQGAPLQPRHHVAARGRHGRHRPGPAAEGRGPEGSRGPPGLRPSRADPVPRKARRLRARRDLPLARRREDRPGHREAHRGPHEPRARHWREGGPGDHPRRGQRSVRLLVPAGALHRGDQPLAQPRARRGQPLAQADAPAGAAEDPPLPHLRGGVGALQDLSGEHPRGHLRHRVPARRRARPTGRRGALAPRARRAARHPDHAAVEPQRERGAGQRGGSRLPAQGLAGAPPAAPALHRRELRLRRLRLPAARRHRAGPCARPEDAGGDAPYGPRGLPRLSRRAKPLLDLAEGAHRVRSGPQPPAAHGRRLRRPGKPEAAAHPGDPGLPRPAGPAHRGRFRPRDVRRLLGVLAPGRRLSRRQGPRPGFRQRAPGRQPRSAAVFGT